MAGFVFIKQHDAMQCGAACLAMLCHLYGGNLVLPLNP
ncbi:MAG: cysteine peptidase family C39 domain-containing protein [Prevotella multiformis]|nr:cysteine peptidase family C39 domain-containing protein [Prevotella multiformis]